MIFQEKLFLKNLGFFKNFERIQIQIFERIQVQVFNEIPKNSKKIVLRKKNKKHGFYMDNYTRRRFYT